MCIVNHPVRKSCLEPAEAQDLYGLCARLREDITIQRPFVQVNVAVSGSCPARLDHVVRRAVDELVTNALEHGFTLSAAGRVELTVALANGDGACITVRDSGLGFAADDIAQGNGFRLLQMMGTLTVAQVTKGAALRLVIGGPSWCMMFGLCHDADNVFALSHRLHHMSATT